MGLSNPSRETKFSGANGDREILIFPVRLTTSRIGNLTRLILTLAIFVTIRKTIRNQANARRYLLGSKTSPGEERGNETGKVAIAHGSVEFCEATPIGLADES